MWTVRYTEHVLDTDTGKGEHPGAVLRRLRHTAGRRLSQEALATLLGTSRAHIARLELRGSPPLTDEQLDRLEKAIDAVRPPFSRDEIDELRKAMQAVEPAAVEQADKAVQDLAARAGQIFGDHPGERYYEDPPLGVPDPFASSSRPMFLTNVTQAVAALQEDLEHLIQQRRVGPPSLGGAEPDVVLAWFERNLAEEAEDPEKLRDALREVLRRGGTAEILMAASAGEASEDLIALVPPFIAYLGQGGNRYRVRVIDEPRHPLAYDICIVGDRALLIVRGPGGRTAVARTNDPGDVTALRDLLRPYRENRGPIIEEVGRRTRESVTSRVSGPSVGRPFEELLTSVEREEGPRRLVKQGLSILNIPVAIHAWKWRAAELCTAGWIPEDLLTILHAQAWQLADRGLWQLPPAVLADYPPGSEVCQALDALEEYARGLQRRRDAWLDQLSRHQFWDACPKSALTQFISTGKLPPDEIPPACTYAAERDDIETIITQLIARLRSSRNYHLALIDKPPIPQWFYFGVKADHVLAQVFDYRAGEECADETARTGDNLLNIHIDYAPIAAAFAGWFDEHVLKAAVDPPWQDNRSVASWLETELEASRHLR